MAHRNKHRIAAMVKRATTGRKIKSDYESNGIVPAPPGKGPGKPYLTRRTTDEYKAAKKIADKIKKAAADE